MKLKIPPANKIFSKDKKLPKKPSMEQIVMDWLNTEVYNKIINAEPKLSTKEVKVIGSVSIEVPFDGYYDNPNAFKLLVKARLEPLGYNVDITYDGMGMKRDICFIRWEHVL